MNTWPRGYLASFLIGVSSLSATAAVISSCDQAGLQAALTAGGSYTFTCDGVITLNQTLNVDKDVTLDASGHNVVVSGGLSVRIFKVEAGASFTLKNLVLANGRYLGTNGLNGRGPSTLGPPLPITPGEPALGGAILNDGGVINLVSCIVSNNAAIGGTGGNNATGSPEGKGGDAEGGAIFVRGGTFGSVGSRFLNNLALGGRSGLSGMGVGTLPGHSFGGAIFNEGGTLHLTNNIFVSNLSTGVQSYSTTGSLGPDGNAGNAQGGALHSEGGAVYLQNCSLSNNAARGGDALANFGSSGVARGGALSLSNASLFSGGSVFVQNGAYGGEGHFRYSTFADGSGGAIFNAGIATIENGLFRENVALTGYAATTGGPGKGGALCNLGTLNCNRSLFVENSALGGRAGPVSFVRSVAGDGLGGAVYNGGTLNVTNVTLFKNQAQGGAGEPGQTGPGTQGLGGGGALFNASGNVTLVNATLANNLVGGGMKKFAVPGPAQGGGIFATNGSVTLQDTIVAYSVGGSNLFGTANDGGYNLSSDASFSFSALGSLNSTDPLLGPLQDNGGPTFTLALTDCSPAVNAGNPIANSPSDQRGAVRPLNGRSDVGAFEGIVTWYHTVLSVNSLTMNMKIVGKPGQTFVLNISPDLSSWNTILTNTIGSNCTYEYSSPAASQSFYRVSYY